MGDISYLAYSMASGKVLNQKEGLVISVGFHHDSNFTGKVKQLKTIKKTLIDSWQLRSMQLFRC